MAAAGKPALETGEKKLRPVGLAKGTGSVPASFFESVPDEFIDAFYGNDNEDTYLYMQFLWIDVGPESPGFRIRPGFASGVSQQTRV